MVRGENGTGGERLPSTFKADSLVITNLFPLLLLLVYALQLEQPHFYRPSGR